MEAYASPMPYDDYSPDYKAQKAKQRAEQRDRFYSWLASVIAMAAIVLIVIWFFLAR